MLPTRKKARVTRPVTPPSSRPVTPPTACPQSSVMCGLSDSSASDSPPCSVRPVIKYDLAADAQQALSSTASPTHVANPVIVGVPSADMSSPAPSHGELVGSPLKHVVDGSAQPVVAHPPSPSQREAFLASLQVMKVTTNLSIVNAQPGARLNFDGTIVVVYPCETNPVRRHVLLADEHGVCGITLWNQNASKVNGSLVGTIAQLTKVMIASHLGKKSLTMNKESGLVITNKIAPFWTQLLDNPVVPIIDVHSMSLNKFVSVGGILGFMHSEMKIVRNEEKELVILRIVDRTGSIEVQSWVSKLTDFEQFRDRPIQMQRMRITEYSGVKYLEIIDGNGTQVHGEFEGALDLANFWAEPARV